MAVMGGRLFRLHVLWLVYFQYLGILCLHVCVCVCFLYMSPEPSLQCVDRMSVQVMKELVDEVKPDKGIPHCELLAKVMDPKKREPLHYTVKVEGTKYPYSFTVHIDGMMY